MSETNDLFVRAARKKYRFDSVRGELTAEQLWDLPLLARNGFDLDSVGLTVNLALKAMGEESFVEKANPEQADATAKLEIVKFVIATKQAEAKAAEQRAERTRQRRKILDAIAEQEDKELTSASKEELLKRLEALEAAD